MNFERTKVSSNELLRLVHQSGEPVFITKNGEGDMVLMSLSQYGELQKRLDLYAKLAMAEEKRAAGDQGRPQS
ncbi:type II toxin-antitoxin system prevent-host-death family antitoxin [Candidatus Nitrospira salsa]